MDEILKKLLASEVFTPETRKQVSEAFQQAVKEAQATERKKVAEQYAKTRKQLVGAAQEFIESNLTEVVAEYREGIKQTETLRGKYATLIESVKSSAKSSMEKRAAVIEKYIRNHVAKEIKELHESEKVSRRAYLTAINEYKTRGLREHEEFKKKAALVLNEMINTRLEKILVEFQDDIRAARQSDFGREMYEAFYTTFRHQFFNANKEFSTLTEKVRIAESKVKKVTEVAAKKLNEADERVKSSEATRAKLEESIKRQRQLSVLLKPLTGATREKMKTILESVAKSDDMKKTYDRFLPDMLAQTTPAQPNKNRKLSEASIEIRTGGLRKRVDEEAPSNAGDDEIVAMKRRAGITR